MTTTPPAPTLTPATDANPCPRIEVLIHPMPVDAATVTVWRVYNGQQEPVRGALNAVTAGDFLVVDYEAPLGVDVTYVCETADVSGTPSLASPASSVANLAVTDVWAQDPVDPSTAMPWSLKRATNRPYVQLGSFTGMTYSADSALVTAVGSPLPIGISGVRRAAAGIPMALAVWGDDLNGTLFDLLSQAFPLLVRTPARVKVLPALAYLRVGDIAAKVDPNGQRTVWSMNGDQIAGPGLGIIVALRTYDDVAAQAATYTNLAALYSTYINLQRG